MVSVEKISRKFIQLDEYLGILDEISKVPEKVFLKDKILIGSAKYYLQISIECCLDVANHIIASGNDTERPRIMQILLPCWRKKALFSSSLDKI